MLLKSEKAKQKMKLGNLQESGAKERENVGEN